MSKEEYVEILNSAFNNGTPFINITEFYSYALIPMGGDKWVEISYDLEEKNVEKREVNATKAYNMLNEEIEKGMADLVDDLNIFKWKEFKATLTGTDGEKIEKAVKEIIGNASNYSTKLPVVFNKDDIAKVISKI